MHKSGLIRAEIATYFVNEFADGGAKHAFTGNLNSVAGLPMEVDDAARHEAERVAKDLGGVVVKAVEPVPDVPLADGQTTIKTIIRYWVSVNTAMLMLRDGAYSNWLRVACVDAQVYVRPHQPI